VEIARRRVSEVTTPSAPGPGTDEDFESRATRDGKGAQKLAESVLTDAGFTITERNRRVRKTGVTINFVASDANGDPWFFDVPGGFKTHRGGLLRTDAVWRALGRANALRDQQASGIPLVLLTTHLPKRQSEGDRGLRAAGPLAFFDAVDMLSDDARARLELYAKGGYAREPLPGFWTTADLARRSE
jgi:hypothetical protein